MPDYTENEKREQNKQVFKEYYLKTWVPSNLNSKGINLILEIFQLSNPSEINKAVIQKLSTQYKSYFNIKEKDETDDTIDEINRIIEVGNTSYNISLGDVLLLLTYLKERLDSTYDKMLIFAIETFYSMRLYEYYDLMTEKYKYEKRAKLNENVDYSIKKKDVLDGSTAYKMLVGGSFVNTETTKVMSPQKNNIRRDIRPINKSVLDKLFNEVNENGGINCDKLKWVEFFVLFTSRKYYDARRAGVSEEKWRKQNEVTYKTNLDSPRLLFDVFSIFNNITDVKEQYNRYNPELFELASQKGINSLYNKIIEECYYTRNRTSNPPDEKWDKEWSLKSSGCIRNIDVLESLIENVNLLKKAYHKENYQHLRSFLNRISEFSIMTYDKKNEKDRYTIKFEFVNVLSDFFKSQCDDIALSENEGVIHPFERVYSSCVEEKTEEQKENNSFKTLAESLSWKTGSSARKKIFEAYPEYAKDKHFISIVEAQIPNGFTIKRKNSAQKIIEDILNKYQSANYEQPF